MGLTHLASNTKGTIDNLSAGEKQRVGLARALYSANDLLILDEPTSNLDLETEEKILKTLRKFKRKLTIVMVAHRTSTLTYCDKVFEIKNFKINPRSDLFLDTRS